ncbi:MAG: hypothetical protein WCY16_03025 [Weeksellaceae bacterium]
MKMQPNKDKKTLSEINRYFDDSTSLVGIFTKLLCEFDLRYINKLFSASKVRGTDGKHIFQTLFLLRFLDFGNINQFMLSGVSKEVFHKKDVFL